MVRCVIRGDNLVSVLSDLHGAGPTNRERIHMDITMSRSGQADSVVVVGIADKGRALAAAEWGCREQLDMVAARLLAGLIAECGETDIAVHINYTRA